jgi:NADH-quinone oxidoreductase subunit G
MPIVYIDNKKIEANKGETVIQAAQRNGVYIPHFCWHPELSIAGNCRMCLVEVGNPKRNKDGSFEIDANNEKVISYMPKLQIACNTIVGDDMHIITNSQKCIDTRAAVMEFLLINHPLDCPICDEAGGCKLQGYSNSYSCSTGSRFTEEKNHHAKRHPFNSKIMYDGERCIHCSRCIRFSKEIAGEEVLTMANRGDRVEVHCINPQHNDEIQNNYSMNIIDTCPVGALTSRDFRFKSRVWEMSFNKSICTGCSRGCNVTVGIRNNEVLRLSPMPNIYVNKYWMCDDGRLNTPAQINNNRLHNLKVKNTNGAVTWDEAMEAASKLLKQAKSNEVYFIASPLASNESNYLLQTLNNRITKNTANIGYIPRIDKTFADEMLRTDTKAPNTNGLSALGIKPLDVADIVAKINSGKITTIFAIDEDFSFAPELVATFGKLPNLILCSFNENPAVKFADVVLPTTIWAESEGTFTNCDNRVQHFMPTMLVNGNMTILEAMRRGMDRSRPDRFGEDTDVWNQKPTMDVKQTWWILNGILKNVSAVHYKAVSNVFNEMADSMKAFNGMNYQLLDKHQGITLGKASEPDPIVHNYYSSRIGHPSSAVIES